MAVSPLKAIHNFCKQCQGSAMSDILLACAFTACPLYRYRMGTKPKEGAHSPLKAIRAYCLKQCQAGDTSAMREVTRCAGNKPSIPSAVEPCPIYLFRQGKNPNRKRAVSPS